MQTLRKSLAMAVKEMQIFFKDRGVAFTVFFLPLLISALSAASFAGDSGNIELPVVIVDQDPGQYSQDILDILVDIEELQITYSDSPAAAEALVTESQALAAILFPPDFTTQIDAYTPTTITLVLDPTQPQYARIITTIMEEAIAPAVVQGEYRHGVRAVWADSSVDTQKNPDAARAQAAQEDGAVSTQLKELEENPPVKVQKEILEGASVRGPDNIFSALMPGWAVMFAFFMMFSLSGQLLEEKAAGTLRRLLSAPISRSAIIGGKVLGYQVVILAQMLLVFAASNLLFKMPVPLGWPLVGLILTSMALGLAAASLGMMIASLARSKSQAQWVGLLLIFLLGGLGGCIQIELKPLYRAQGFIGFLSRLTPQAHALESFRRLMIEGYGLVDVLPQIAILLGMAALFFAIAIWRFRFE